MASSSSSRILRGTTSLMASGNGPTSTEDTESTSMTAFETVAPKLRQAASHPSTSVPCQSRASKSTGSGPPPKRPLMVLKSSFTDSPTHRFDGKCWLGG